MLSKNAIEFLNKVKSEGTNKTRYDKLIEADTWKDNNYDVTSTIFIYDYEGKKVVIFMEKGEDTNYFILN